jgi:hypothetical protein
MLKALTVSGRVPFGFQSINCFRRHRLSAATLAGLFCDRVALKLGDRPQVKAFPLPWSANLSAGLRP